MTPVLTAAIAAACVLPLSLRLLAARRVVLANVLWLTVAIVIGIAARTVTPDVPLEPTSRPVERLGDGYVGSGTCTKCHPGEHASWQQSFHRTMTQSVSRPALRAIFDDLQLDYFGAPVSLHWRGSELFVRLSPDARGRRNERKVVQLTGSHHAQVLWYETGNQRELGIVPMVYRIAEQRWLPFPAVFLMPPQLREPPLPGTWNGNCNGCHTTHSMPRLDTDRVDTMAAEFGIACEACHGPGERHTTANANPLRRYGLHYGGKSSDDTVAQPTRMSSARSNEVCGQCHSVSIVKQQHFDTWRDHGSPFRPGEELAQSQLVVSPQDRSAPELHRKLEQDPQFFAHTFWNDGLPRVTGRELHGIRASPCYVGGEGERSLSCTSCHRMHREQDDAREPSAWASSQLGQGMDGNAACTQCHPKFEDATALQAHTHHAPRSAGSSCYDCHMPHTSYGLMKAMRSHSIESPSVARELQTGRPNACNLCHLDRTLQWTQNRLQEWYGTEPSPLDEDQRSVAAGPRWLLQGDAGIRALAAWSSGYEPARAASGHDWLQPYLAQLLSDPYYAVRFVARRSLMTLPSAPSLAGYDELAETGRCQETTARLQLEFAATSTRSARTEILLDEGGMQWDTFRRILARRDDRPVFLAE